MDETKKNLKGSESHDIFKRKHKDLHRSFYASDADLCLISFNPAGVVAYLDYKKSNDSVTPTETILYNTWMSRAPVYIIECDDPENGPFEISRYLGGNAESKPPQIRLNHEQTCSDWFEFEEWEYSIRQEYKKRNGWNGNLKK